MDAWRRSMKRLVAVALVGLLVLVPFTDDALAGQGKGKGKTKAGHSTEQGAQRGNKDHPKPPKHAGVIAAEDANDNVGDNENDNVGVGLDDNDNDHDAANGEEPAKVGVCHATGNGPFVFIQVSTNARGHLEHHADDIVGVAGPEDCPDTAADAE
jgi:hypothetical protein